MMTNSWLSCEVVYNVTLDSHILNFLLSSLICSQNPADFTPWSRNSYLSKLQLLSLSKSTECTTKIKQTNFLYGRS